MSRASPNPDDYLARLGQAVVKAREEAGFSQEALGFEAALDRTYISGIERGVRNPSVKSLLKVAAALGTTPGELLMEAERRRRRRR